ncbi:MAG: hypothetical protein PHH37_08325 [Paludibacter sp.]|nr:hypothetical protein [Paludibacter sp.]
MSKKDNAANTSAEKTVEKAATKGTAQEAEKLMKKLGVKEIWYCSVTGYWFTKSDLAAEHGKKIGKTPENYKL